MKTNIIVFATSLCLLAACSQKASESSADGGAKSAGAAASDVETPVVDIPGLPRVAVGYWELTQTEGSKAPVTSRFCQADEPLSARFVDNTGCVIQTFKRNGRGDIIDYATCNKNPYTVIDRSVYHGDLKQAYVVDETIRTTSSIDPPQLVTYHMTYRLVGPCPPAGKPSK